MILGVPCFTNISISLSSRSYTRTCTEDRKGHEDRLGIGGCRHELGYLCLLLLLSCPAPTTTGTNRVARSNRFQRIVILCDLCELLSFCANDSWCFPVSLLARIQIDISLSSRSYTRISQKATKDTMTDQEVCFRHDLGPSMQIILGVSLFHHFPDSNRYR